MRTTFTNRRLAVCLLMLSLSTTTHATQELDSIVAIVDEDVITRVEFEARTRDITYQLKRKIESPEQLDALRRQVLEKLIRDKIQLQQAARLGIKIDDITLNKMINRIAAANQISTDDLRRVLEADGLSYSRFRENTREELIIKQLQQRLVANRVSVSDQEIDQLIEQQQNLTQKNNRYLLKHILVTTPETASPDEVDAAKAKIDSILARLGKGEEFSELAIQESAGRNALQGGDLGWRDASELPELFVSNLSQMEVGDVSSPIRSASGFHLIKLIERSAQQGTVIQTHARHILIKNTIADDSARERLEDIRKRILAGDVSFEEMATTYSDDKGSREKGGDLGWADPGTFVPTFESTMQTLETGEISAPVESQFGWHIIQVLERRSSAADRKSMAAQAEGQIRKRKLDEELRLWLRKIRDEAYVEYVDDTYATN